MYKLTIPILGESPEIEISDELFSSISHAKIVLSSILAIEEKYDLVVGNYYELEKEIIEKSLNDTIYAKTGVMEIFDDSRDLNRKILNLLSTAKLFLDQLPRHVKEIDSAKIEIAKTEISKKRKTEKCFRIMEALRNHIQHYDLSTSSSSCIHIIDGKTKRIPIFYTILRLNIKEFFCDYKMKKEFENEFIGEEYLELNQLVLRYFEGIFSILKSIRNILKSDFDVSKKIIDDCIFEYSKVYPKIAEQWQKILCIIKDDEIGIKQEFSRNSIELIDRLQKRNTNQENISMRVIGNFYKEIIDEIR